MKHKLKNDSFSVLDVIEPQERAPKVIYRAAGDSYLLVEYGEMVLDLNLRFRIDSLQQQLADMNISGLLEASPGIRTVLLQYDPLRLPQKKLVRLLKQAEKQLPSSTDRIIESRIVHLPLAFHEKWTREAIDRYMNGVRSTGPYLPDNVEFVARCNGLDNKEEILEKMTGTRHLVMGLGDVYLGAPCMVPIDPRNRLVVPKYNPARTFTPEGAVGIGGSYICIYPMESPGGYQLVGRTLPIWDTFQTLPDFKEAPWLLRIFDQVQFFPVSEDELESLWKEFKSGDYTLKIETAQFDVGEYNQFVSSISSEIKEFQDRQEVAIVEATKGY